VAARVTLVTHYYPAHRGGVERVAGQLAERLAASGTAEFEWHASDCDAAPAAVRGITLVPARSWNGIERLLGFPYPLWSVGALCRLWKACRSADLVHIHDCLYLPNVVAYIAARRVLVTQHIGHVPYRNPLLRVLLWIANGILGRWILGGADQVVFESATVQAYFSRFVRFRSPPVLIANGVDTERFAPAQVPGPRVLLFLGRFVEKKGLAVLHELAQRLPDVHWVLAGWGPLDPSAWGLANVTVVPSPGAAQLASLYQAADLFVLPSVGEGVPLSLQEAMACGTPALVGEETAAGIPGAELVLLRERVGDAGTVERWSKRIRALLGSGELQALRPRVAAFAREHWSWQRCAARYAEIIASLRR
jgi:glycosyltransferase involved in cell wall biosynthesis